MVSKELVAYLETLVAFTLYYRADDGRMSGKMETFYMKALKRYKQYQYKDFHKYISKKLIAFYNRFDPAEVKEEPAEPGSPKEGDVVEAGTRAAGVCVVGRASGRNGLARFGATHPAPDSTRGERCVRARAP